ncbi:MAG: 4-hydroxy-tetrahydrodipicolinate synthase [Ruminococcaceae bacterium]|nr:4-hydroxy-tetrahydrodipicolinate synthase [Oscillospiraceae bacterium]
MKNKQLFRGAATAVVTPFKNGNVDYSAFEKILDFQISSGINALVISGTTGESCTLSDREWRDTLSFAVDHSKGKVPVIAGCGSNSTANAEYKTALAEDLGADGILSVTPYYNKATPRGLVLHYKKIASATKLPIILYNVPGRTGVDIPTEVYEELQDTENILGIKEASGNAARSAELISLFKERYFIYSGADEINLPILALGGDGVISVLSNIVPEMVVGLCNLAFAENTKRASELSASLHPLIKALFCEINPIPVKTALAEMGFCNAEFRLPLCEMSEKNREYLTDVLRNLSVI